MQASDPMRTLAQAKAQATRGDVPARASAAKASKRARPVAEVPEPLQGSKPKPLVR